MSEFVERRVGDFLGRYEPPPARADESAAASRPGAPKKLTAEQIFTF
jgi:hypothetical protein